MEQATRLEMALTLVRAGFALLPLRPRGKEPLTDLLPKDAAGKAAWGMLANTPASEADLRRWFRLAPNLNVGVITGRASGNLVVLDFDGPVPSGFYLPPTATVRTSRGTHYYVRAESPTGSRRIEGGDLKGEGGYVVAPPSIHPDGTPYEWCDFCAPSQIGIATVPAELLPGTVRPKQKPRPNGQPSKNKDRYSCSPPCSLHGYSEGRERLIQWASRPDVASAILQSCGVTSVEVGVSFHCPLPGHQERSPSATLWRQPDGRFGLHDWHHRSGPEWFSLAEVFAACKTGTVAKLPPGEHGAWLCRALLETGIEQYPELRSASLPNNASPTIRAVYDGFCLLLAARSLYNPQQVGAPFSWRFASRWCGTSQEASGKAIRWLIDHDYLEVLPGFGHGRLTILTLKRAGDYR